MSFCSGRWSGEKEQPLRCAGGKGSPGLGWPSEPALLAKKKRGNGHRMKAVTGRFHCVAL